MEPSFELSKRGRIWWATTKLPTGNEKSWTTGCYDKADAEKKAKKWCEMVHRLSRAGMRGGRMHGKHTRQRKEAVSRAVEEPEKLPRGPKPAAAAPSPRKDPEGPAADDASSPPSGAGPEGSPIGAERAAEIAAKLRSLGDAPDPDFDSGASSADGAAPDEYFSPGAGPSNDNSGTEPGENEAGDLLADVIALGVVAATVKGVAVRCKKAKPPRKPGEPNEKMIEWYHAGLRHNIRRLVGNAGALGPTGKMFVGAAGVILTMLWGSELVDPPKEEAPQQTQRAPTNGVHREPAPEEQPPPQTSTEITAMGRFV